VIERVFGYSTGDEKAVERIIMDENVNYIHMVFNKNEGMPEHYSNSNVYMSVIRGTLSLQLADQDVHEYKRGDIIQIPYNIKMNVGNRHDETLEIFVVKAPAPDSHGK